MSPLTIVRTVHFAALMALFGGFTFLLLLARPVFDAVGATPPQRARFHRRLMLMASWSLVAVLASGAAWLALQAANVSGRPLDQALTRAILSAVWTRTQFGQVLQVRFVFALLVAVVLWFGRRRSDSKGWLLFGIAGTVLAGLLTAGQSFAGHAIDETGTDRIFSITSDVIHLLAAGAWLGALLPLYWILQSVAPEIPSTLAAARKIATRFSVLGITCVSALVVTGLVNSWFLVGNVPGLIGTEYGRLLMVKIAFFLAMLCCAAFNKTKFTPRLLAASDPDRVNDVLWWLKRSVLVETMFGLAVLAVLAALGSGIPALHSHVSWPLPFALDWPMATAQTHTITYVAAAISVVALALAIWAASRRRYVIALVGAVGVLAAVVIPMDLLAEPAFPTSFIYSPVPYGSLSVAHGEPIFKQNCTACHGDYGYGDGPAAASLPIKPANLTGVHIFHHPEGTLFWWVSKGVAGTPMPPFEDVLSEQERWDVLNFLHAQADAEQGNSMTTEAESWRPITAPDFGFQIGDDAPETLKDQRGRYYVLLVLIGGPDAPARIKQLAAAQAELLRAGIRVIAVPMGTSPATENVPQSPIVAEVGPEVVATYSLYRRIPSLIGVPPVSDHMEFLIDRQGYLRFRWIPGNGPGPGWEVLADLEKRVDILNREPPRPPAGEGGMHMNMPM